jgi:hypothetical protein
MGFSSFKSYGSKVAIPNIVSVVVAKTKRIVSFTIVGATNFIVPSDVSVIEILLIGGGGGGGYRRGGGGGAGGFVYIQNLSVQSNTTYTINVGVGGIGDINSFQLPNGGIGGNSTFGNLAISHGGGGGGDDPNSTLDKGGSGGGGSPFGIDNSGTKQIPGEGYLGEGFSGGFGSDGTYAGGGGGASEKGHDSTLQGNSNGGSGLPSSISGSEVYYSGGGTGGTHLSRGTAIPGGRGGGGFGGFGGISGGSGLVNTGGGGGGGSDNSAGGNGGSGIVIISYLSSL